MNRNKNKGFPEHKKKLQDILAINVSPIKVEHTPENVGSKFKNPRDLKTGISDFNPFDLIESTDTSKGQRDSNNQLRRSHSCANSPTRRDDLDQQFQKAVGKFISGYSFNLALNEESNEDAGSKEVLSEGTSKHQKAYRYSQGSEEDDDEDFDCEYIRQAGRRTVVGRDTQSNKGCWPQSPDGRHLFSQTNDLRRSKSYDKHILVMDQYTTPTSPSGPQYNVQSGGTVKHMRMISSGTKQKLSSGRVKKQVVANIAKFNKIESTYAKTDRKNAILVPADPGKKKKILVKPLKKNQIIKKDSIAFKVEGPTNDGQEPLFRITRKGSKKALGQKAFTTGNRMSEGTDGSVKRSPSQNPQFSEFAQTAYAFELKNALQNPDRMTADLFEQAIEAGFEEYQLPAINPKSVSMKHAKNQFSGQGVICDPAVAKQALTNQVSKRNLLYDEQSQNIGSDVGLNKQQSQDNRMISPPSNQKIKIDANDFQSSQKLPQFDTPGQLYKIKKRSLKLQGTLPKLKDRHALNRELLQREILKFKQKIFNVPSKIIENTHGETAPGRQKAT